MSPILINGAELPVEMVGYDWGIADLDGESGTGRNEATGQAFRDRIARVRQLKIDIGPSSVADMSTMLQLIRDEFVSITYLDAFDGAWRTDEFYVADRGVQSLIWDGDLDPGGPCNFSGVTWGATSFEFVGKGNPV